MTTTKAFFFFWIINKNDMNELKKIRRNTKKNNFGKNYDQI